MIGTIVNAGAIILGSVIGLLVKKGLPQRVEDAIMKIQGVVIMLIGLNGALSIMLTVGPDGSLKSSGELLLLISLVLGCLAGELLRIHDRIENMGAAIEKRLKGEGFAQGFVNSSIIFCVGAMAIMGSINEGLRGDSSILFVKSALDGITSMVLAASLGWGVAASSVPILVYQGGITLLAGVLGPALEKAEGLVDNICMVGYIIVITIGLNFVWKDKFKPANLLPAILVPVLYYFARTWLGI